MSPTKESTPFECVLLQLPNELLLASDPEDVFSLEKVLSHITIMQSHQA